MVAVPMRDMVLVMRKTTHTSPLERLRRTQAPATADQPKSTSNQSSGRLRNGSVMFTPEKLESRRLLSVAVAFDPISGQLNVFGFGKENEIRVTMVNTNIATNGSRPKAITQRPGPL